MTSLLQKYQDAKAVFDAAFRAIVGEHFDALEYTSIARGAEGSALRVAFDAKCAAHDAYVASISR